MKDKIIADLLVLIQTFEELGIVFFLQDGLSLGYGRHQDVIDTDRDIDIGISQELTDKEKRQLYKKLRELGWRHFYDSTDFFYAYRLVKLNIWYYHKEGNMMVSFPETWTGEFCAFPAHFLEKPDKVDFHGAKVHVPHDLDTFLDFRYGKDWKEKTYPTSEAWKKVEEYVFKWKHKIPNGQNPLTINKRWLIAHGSSFGQTLLMSMKEAQPHLPSSSKKNS